MTSIPNTFETIKNFSMIQTFYADPDIVNRSGTVTFTSVDLFFKPLFPVPGVTGKRNPAVVVQICECDAIEPNLSKVYSGVSATRFYSEIVGFSDASGSKTFSFNTPLTVPTDRMYGIVITFDDPGFELWQNKLGDRVVGTNNGSPGSNLVKDGKLYLATNAGNFRAQSDTDLKFALKVAQYTANTISQTYVTPNYEFFTISGASGRFIGGEQAFQAVANLTGNVQFTAGTKSIRSTTSGGANFDTLSISAGNKLVLFSNSTYKDVVQVQNKVNSSVIETTSTIVHSNTGTNFMRPPVGTVYYYDSGRKKLYLRNSNANTALKFQANANVLTGEDSKATCTISSVDNISADRIRLNAGNIVPSRGLIDKRLTFAFEGTPANTADNLQFSLDNQIRVDLNNPVIRNINQYNAFIQSRSLEVNNTNLIQETPLDGNTGFRIDRPSAIVNTTLSIAASNTELYIAPAITDPLIDMFVITNVVSNTFTSTDANSVVFDTEVKGPFLAESKHISTKVNFANNKFAEDIRVFMTAYRPTGTNINVYTRVHNSADSDAFDDRAWSPLEYKENKERFSSKDNQFDYVEYELGLSPFPESAKTLAGTFTTSLSSNTITAFGVAPNAANNVAAGDLIKLYNPLISEDYIIDVVSAANTTAIQLESSIANNNVVGDGFKVDRLKYFNTAFNNITNDNVARYFNSSLVTFDKFDTMQIKIVFLSDKTFIAPKVEQIQVIGVSA